MLYDPNWNKQKKADPRSLEGLIQWLETQNPDTRYPALKVDDCLLARYFRAKGYWYAFGTRGRLNYSPVPFLPPFFRTRYPEEMDKVAWLQGPSNYGAALKRAKAMLARSVSGDGARSGDASDIAAAQIANASVLLAL